MIKEILVIFDRIMCTYLGLNDSDIEKPKSVIAYDNKIFIAKNHLFQRHKFYETISSAISSNGTTTIQNMKIGRATGKAIANNLNISFEPIEVKK